MDKELTVILDNYPLAPGLWQIRVFGSGLINRTWKVTNNTSTKNYILQKINTSVFANANAIAENIAAIGSYLRKNHPDYLFLEPLQTKNGDYLLKVNDAFHRLTPFAEGSHTVDTVNSANEAFEAAKQFGRFTAYLKDFPAETLHTTLPDFHNLSFRVKQFKDALQYAPFSVLKICSEQIKELETFSYIENRWEKIKNNEAIPLRVIHHDTKISNCLFDDEHKGMAVIDLDTVMPGYYISDTGDMCRSYLCPLNEESTDFENIDIRLDFFEAITEGYLCEMGDVLTPNELELFTYSGQFLMYMQALRFLADYLAGNPYYPVKHPMHNLNRTINQLTLLKKYTSREKELKQIVRKHIGHSI
jgi:Ser/Thr protein kinase RdoA (MazF antagonist)